MTGPLVLVTAATRTTMNGASETNTTPAQNSQASRVFHGERGRISGGRRADMA